MGMTMALSRVVVNTVATASSPARSYWPESTDDMTHMGMAARRRDQFLDLLSAQFLFVCV